jgi:hypothetical protein
MSVSAPSLAFLKKPQFQYGLIIIIPFIFVVVLYIIGWSQSQFRCIDLFRPLRYPFIISEQISGCRTFSDLNNYQARITAGQLESIINIKAKEGVKIEANEAYTYAFGRAKIEEYARKNKITVSDEEVNKEVAKEIKDLGGQDRFLGSKTMEERKAEVKGVLLQSKVEDKLIDFVDAEWVALRWDVRVDEAWKPNISLLRVDASNALSAAKNSFEAGESAEQAQKAVENSGANLSNYGFNLGDRQKLVINEETAKPYKSVVGARPGVTDIICDDRFCVVFKIFKTNNGDYSSMEVFLGDLKGW